MGVGYVIKCITSKGVLASVTCDSEVSVPVYGYGMEAVDDR